MCSRDNWLKDVADKAGRGYYNDSFSWKKMNYIKMALDVRRNNKVFSFSSNLSDILQYLHSLKSILSIVHITDITKHFVLSCISPLIMHQIHQNNIFGFIALPILSDIDQSQDDKYFYFNNTQIIKSLFNMLYSPNNTDKKLNELIQKYHKLCIEMQSKMNIDTNNYEEFCLESVPMDIFCYILSFIPPKNLRNIQCVSYSFYSAIQKPAANIILNGDILWKIMRKFNQQSLSAEALGLYHYDINFFKQYSSIKQLSISCYTLQHLMEYFNHPNIETFLNQFTDIKQLKFGDIEQYLQHHSFDDLLQDLVKTKYLKHTLQHLILTQCDKEELYIKISVQTFEYFKQFIHLNSLQIDGYIILHDDLQDFEYINNHYLQIQSFIKHINHISIGCQPFDPSITPSFFSLFFLPNIKSLHFRLSYVDIPEAFIDFLEEIHDFKENGKQLHGLKNLRNLEEFNIFIEPTDLFTTFREYHEPEFLLLSIINNTNNLHRFIVSQWNKRLVFGKIDINNIDIDNNILYKVVSNNINTLNSICFEHDTAHYAYFDGLDIDSWIPLFLIHNILINSNNFEYIEYWMKNIFKEFKFCVIINNEWLDIEEYNEKFNNLKIYFFPEIQSIMRSLRKLFKKYDIKYSMKLEFECEWTRKTIQVLYVNQFKEATVTNGILNFKDNNQTLITHYFSFI